ncbi:uncharacterized protein PHALS_03102 [Plasmopara halstedii]|uniref:Uncharacterized protein n=1 Tax=Plasmopara halstedii TaxID=4781 RepID=A0A0P1A8A3_PLAHL|nr:uncharacterized protein PHALS_03102 [Plasmopara halstedii]CEG36554.1 hypothetical protein PHALS_03102 [Plasmopara halstedii]|eukprot:XP_024572923.1 hypothetical protein PHALS_03102 [Plasmopara halstedii]
MELSWVILTALQDHHQLQILTVNESCWTRLTSVLTSENQTLLVNIISGAEFTYALKHMKASSSPDMDGLTASFYHVAADGFEKCLSTAFNYQLSHGDLFLPSASQMLAC